MKYFTLFLFTLSACGPSAVPTQQASNPFSNSGQSSPPLVQPTPACAIPIVGVFQNQSDGVTATIAERNGACGIQLSCGLTGYIFDQGGNQYMLIVSTIEGDTIGGCAMPNQSTNFGGKAGPFFQLSFGNYPGIGWHGGFMPSETNNTWSKL